MPKSLSDFFWVVAFGVFADWAVFGVGGLGEFMGHNHGPH